MHNKLVMSRIFDIDLGNPNLKMHEYGNYEYWFYHPGSYPSENPLKYQQIVDNANGEIIV